MERAGRALAEAAYRFAGPMPALILCGPGNNGGDGYVAARHLAERGVAVRIAALADPTSDAAKWARSQWRGEVERLSDPTTPAPLLIDCLFGTGLRRGLENTVSATAFSTLRAAVVRVACDLPSGVESDSGSELSEVPAFDMTVTFGALKPAHRLHPRCTSAAASSLAISASMRRRTGTKSRRPTFRRSIRAGTNMIAASSTRSRARCRAQSRLRPPQRREPALAMSASARREAIEGLPSSVVQTDTAEVNDERIGCLLVGPGMGDIPQLLTLALTSKAPKVIDADAIAQVGEAGAAEGSGCDHHAARGRVPAAVRRACGNEAGAGAGGGAQVGRSRRLQGRGHAGGFARRAARISFRRRRPGSRVRERAMSSPGPSPQFGRGACTPFEAACAGAWLQGKRSGDRRSADDRRRPRRGRARSHRRCARADRPDRRSRRRHDVIRPPRSVRSDRGRAARRRCVGAGAASSGSAVPPFPGVRRLPAAACGRRGLSRLSRLTGRDGAKPAPSRDRNPRAAPVAATRTPPCDASRHCGPVTDVVIGFNAEKSHRIVDMRECHILRRSCLLSLRRFACCSSSLLQPKRSAEVQLTLVDQGADVLLKGVSAEGLTAIEQLTQFASTLQLARLSVDQGLGPETVYEPQPATVTLSGVPVGLPVGGFLQATEDGEAALVALVKDAVAGASVVADLFAGVGTFSLGARVIYAAEASREAAAALKRAAPGMSVDHRDLYRRPLDAAEIKQVRRSHPRSAARRCSRAGEGARLIDGGQHCLRELQCGDLRTRRKGARRRRL